MKWPGFWKNYPVILKKTSFHLFPINPIFFNYRKFWSIWPQSFHFKHRPSIFEEWTTLAVVGGSLPHNLVSRYIVFAFSLQFFFFYSSYTHFFPWIYVKSIWQPDVSSVSNLSIQINLKNTVGLENGRKKYCNKYSRLVNP